MILKQTEENLKELSEIKGVKEVEKGFQYLSMPGMNSITLGDNKSDLMGLMSTSSVLTDSNVSEGSLPKKNEVLINKSVAEQLGDDVIGKTVKLSAVIDGQTVSGDFNISGIYTAGEKEYEIGLARKDGVPINESVQAEMNKVREDLGLTQYTFPWDK